MFLYSFRNHLTCWAFISSSTKVKDHTCPHGFPGFLEGLSKISDTHRNCKRPQTRSIAGHTDRGFYRWSLIQERSQVSEVAVCQFPRLEDLGPEVVVCHKTVDDANAAGKHRTRKGIYCVAVGTAGCGAALRRWGGGTAEGRGFPREPREGQDLPPHGVPPRLQPQDTPLRTHTPHTHTSAPPNKSTSKNAQVTKLLWAFKQFWFLQLSLLVFLLSWLKRSSVTLA